MTCRSSIGDPVCIASSHIIGNRGRTTLSCPRVTESVCSNDAVDETVFVKTTVRVGESATETVSTRVVLSVFVRVRVAVGGGGGVRVIVTNCVVVTVSVGGGVTDTVIVSSKVRVCVGVGGGVIVYVSVAVGGTDFVFVGGGVNSLLKVNVKISVNVSDAVSSLVFETDTVWIIGRVIDGGSVGIFGKVLETPGTAERLVLAVPVELA